MTQTDGLDILLAWAIFLALLGLLAWMVLRAGNADPIAESRRTVDGDPGRGPGEGSPDRRGVDCQAGHTQGCQQ